jgi:hypothetical protein
MEKLVTAYLTAPSLKNAQRIHDYNRAHPMHACMYPELSAVVAVAIEHAKSGPLVPVPGWEQEQPPGITKQ